MCAEIYYLTHLFQVMNPRRNAVCPSHKLNLGVCPQATHGFGIPVISGHGSAREEQNSALVRVDAERVDAW